MSLLWLSSKDGSTTDVTHQVVMLFVTPIVFALGYLALRWWILPVVDRIAEMIAGVK